MPVCFQLFRKGEDQPTPFQTIDEELCIFFNTPVHPTYWFRDWYNTIGFGLAVGGDWNRQREVFHDEPRILEVVDWLEARFTTKAWWESKSHPRKS